MNPQSKFQFSLANFLAFMLPFAWMLGLSSALARLGVVFQLFVVLFFAPAMIGALIGGMEGLAKGVALSSTLFMGCLLFALIGWLLFRRR